MPKTEDQIPAAFRKRLEKKLGITTRGIYKRIGRISAEHSVSPRAAAFLLARDIGVSYSQYATPDDRAEMRGRSINPTTLDASSIQAVAPPRRTASHLPTPRIKIKETKNNTVFLVHGRDTALNETMFAFLRALGLNALEWSQALKKARGANPNVGKIIDNAMKQAQGIIVMFSPDEEAKLKPEFVADPSENAPVAQARPNVTFEAGLALGAHPEKTLLVQIGKTRPISDIAGMHIPRLSNSAVSRKDIAARLKKMGFKVNIDGTSWLTEGDLNR